MRELAGDGELRFVARADDFGVLTQAVLRGASRTARPVDRTRARARGRRARAVARRAISGRDRPRLLQGPRVRRAAPAAVRSRDHRARSAAAIGSSSSRCASAIASRCSKDDDEAALIARLVALVRAVDPDVIENHNLHGFDLPFLVRRAERLGVPLALGRVVDGLRQRGARRGVTRIGDAARSGSSRPGASSIDTLDLALTSRRRARPRPQGGRALARRRRRRSRIHSRRPDLRGLSSRSGARAALRGGRRRGGRARREAARRCGVRARDDGARRYERLVDAGAATGVLDPLIVRAYLAQRRRVAGTCARRRHATQRRGAALVRGGCRASRDQGRRRELVSIADARASHRACARSARRAARARRSARRATARREGRSARRGARIRRALQPRSDVRRDEARRQLGVWLSRRAAGSRGSPTFTPRTRSRATAARRSR